MIRGGNFLCSAEINVYWSIHPFSWQRAGRPPVVSAFGSKLILKDQICSLQSPSLCSVPFAPILPSRQFYIPRISQNGSFIVWFIFLNSKIIEWTWDDMRNAELPDLSTIIQRGRIWTVPGAALCCHKWWPHTLFFLRKGSTPVEFQWRTNGHARGDSKYLA